jgi:hypothetical protein
MHPGRELTEGEERLRRAGLRLVARMIAERMLAERAAAADGSALPTKKLLRRIGADSNKLVNAHKHMLKPVAGNGAVSTEPVWPSISRRPATIARPLLRIPPALHPVRGIRG